MNEGNLDLARLASDLKDGEPVRLKLLGGYLDVERPLPVLVAYRAGDPTADAHHARRRGDQAFHR